MIKFDVDLTKFVVYEIIDNDKSFFIAIDRMKMGRIDKLRKVYNFSFQNIPDEELIEGFLLKNDENPEIYCLDKNAQFDCRINRLRPIIIDITPPPSMK